MQELVLEWFCPGDQFRQIVREFIESRVKSVWLLTLGAFRTLAA
jgi:hypothetical protein